MTKITKPILIGILLSALLFPTATVQAQFTVYDPVANINSLNQLQQWITAITKYETMITKQIEQVTNLRTIMQHGEKMLGQFKISEWGKLIRMGFKLRWQIESLISAQGRIFMGIQRRALNGILNPQQDMEEFERYLVYSIGRTAEAEKYKLDQAIRADQEIKKAIESMAALSAQTAEFEQAITSNEEAIKELEDCTDCTDRDVQLSQLKIQNEALRTKQQAALKEFREFDEKTTKRTAAIVNSHSKGKFFGKEIDEATKGWENLSKETEETLTIFSKHRQQ